MYLLRFHAKVNGVCVFGFANVITVGMPPHLVAKMMQASAAFRMFDRDCSGYLDKREWKKVNIISFGW